MKRAFLVAVGTALLMGGMLDAQAPPPQATGLSFFKNYFVTGDYIVGGVNLRGTGINGVATGYINLAGGQSPDGTSANPAEDPSNLNTIPNGVDILAAFLYFETVQTPNSGFGTATFRGKLPGQDFNAVNADGTLVVPRNDLTPILKIVNPQ